MLLDSFDTAQVCETFLNDTDDLILKLQYLCFILMKPAFECGAMLAA